ncbi:ABC transporter permease, partial [Gemmatimonas sp.]|uniref:ABC transporter permease n=1 Tax=Gemmatimonas sp. TaxID=1962908 RepID=UPI0033406CAA
MIALLAACVFFSLQSPRFLTPENFSLIAQQVMVVGVLAIGQTLVILTAGIDLSCGMLMALGSVLMTLLGSRGGMSPVAAIALGIGATTLAGTINGLLVTRVKLPPFIVTLGTMNIAFALTQIVSRSQTVTDLPPLLTVLGNTMQVGSARIAYGTVLMLALYAGVWWFL